MDGRPTWTACDEAGDYVVPNVLSPRDLVFRPDNMDKTVPHTINDSVLLIRLKLAFHMRFAHTLLHQTITRESIPIKIPTNQLVFFKMT